MEPFRVLRGVYILRYTPASLRSPASENSVAEARAGVKAIGFLLNIAVPPGLISKVSAASQQADWMRLATVVRLERNAGGAMHAVHAPSSPMSCGYEGLEEHASSAASR